MDNDENTLTVPTKAEELDKLAAHLAGPIEALMAKYMGEYEKGNEERSNAQLASLSKAIDEKVDSANKAKEKVERTFDVPGAEAGDDGARKGQTFSISRFGQAIAQKDWSKAPFEHEVHTELQKTMSSGTDSAGGYLVPEFYTAQIIEKLRANSVALQLGATEIQATKGFPIKIPRLKTDATAYWVGEGTSITASDLVIDQITLSPRTLAARVVLDNLLIENSTPTADAVVNESISAQLGLGLDRAVLRGSGNKEPVGLLNSVTQSEALPGGDEFYIGLMNLVHALAASNALVGNLGFAMNPEILNDIQTGAGIVATEPAVARRIMTEGVYEALVGYKYATTTQLPLGGVAGCILFGNWSDCLIGRWSNLAIKASEETSDAFEKDQVHIRGLMRADTNVRHLESFVLGEATWT